MTIVTCGIWLGALLLIAFGIDKTFSGVLGGKLYRLFMLPGALVHHLSQAIACILTGATIKQVKFFDPKASTVQHTDPKVPGVGPILIAVAPMIACGALLFTLPSLFNNLKLHVGPPLPELATFSLDAFATWTKSFIDTFASMLHYFWAAHYTLSFAVMCYFGLVLSVSVGMDVHGLRFGLMGIAVLTGAAYLFNSTFHDKFSIFAQQNIWPLLSFAVPVALAFLIMSAIAASIAALFHNKSQQKQSREEIRSKLAKLADA